MCDSLFDINATELDRLTEDDLASCSFNVDTFRWLTVVFCRGRLLEAIIGDVGAVVVVVGDLGKLVLDK